MVKLPTLVEMLKNGVHFGHRVSKKHPKMDPYIFGVRETVNIIDLEITLEKLQQALDFVKKFATEGKTVLFVGSKKQAQDIIEEYAKDCKMPYIKERWIGGLFTNFSVIKGLIKSYKELKEKLNSEKIEKYTKKERHEFKKEYERLEKLVGGIHSLEKLPDAVFLIDLRKEKTALKEAKRKKIPVIGLCDTNVSPEYLDYVIPANDDAIGSIRLITKLISESIKEGKEFQKESLNKEK